MSDEKVTAKDVFVLGGSYSTSKWGRAREAEFRAAIESLCAERDQAQTHLEHETAAHLATIETRDYFEETIQECHIQLGGDGEWSNVHDLAEELPEMICEAQAEAERLREALGGCLTHLESINPFNGYQFQGAIEKARAVLERGGE